MTEGRVYVGTAGWSYRDWEGVVYPAGKEKPKDPLAFLARFFSCIEINSTFYRIPAPETVAGWADRTARFPDFQFTVKLWRGFTHEKDHGFKAEDGAAFLAAVEPLRAAGRLGAVLVQFPWYFRNTPDSLKRLDRIAGTFAGLPLVLEVRSASWAADTAAEAIAARGYGICNIDQPLARESLKPASRVSGAVGYVRLHGRNSAAWFDSKAGRDEKYDYLYTADELAEWTARVTEINGRARKTFVIANNHYKGQAAVNGLELMAALTRDRVDVPEPLLHAYPRLKSISRSRYSLFD